jgi:hypothetical protein
MSATTQVTTFSDIEAAWLAAVLDCEGWIGMSWGKRGNGKVYWPRIGVGNTDYRLIQKLVDVTGVPYVRHVIPKSEKHREQWHWKADRRDDVARILLAVLPYLVIKRAQAEAILSLPGWHVKDHAARTNVHDLCQRLNRKGPRTA